MVSRWLWPLLGAAGATAIVFAGFLLWLPSQDDNAWVTRPLGLSLRVFVRHPAGSPPSPKLSQRLHALGEQARRDIKTCVKGVDGAPQQVELVFDEGIVTLASGPVSRATAHGACVGQVLEGLWGEVDGAWRLVVNLSLE